MIDELYQKELLRHAAAAVGHGRIDPPDDGRLLAKLHMDSAEVFAYDVQTSTNDGGV